LTREGIEESYDIQELLRRLHGVGNDVHVPQGAITYTAEESKPTDI
jgi:hypothetical protein